MSNWFVKPQVVMVEGEEQEVDVKIGQFVPLTKPGQKVQLIPVGIENGWISVHLGRKNHDGSVDVSKVHYMPKSKKYTFHHPDGNEYVSAKTAKGANPKLTNVLAPERKVVKEKQTNMERDTVRNYIAGRTTPLAQRPVLDFTLADTTIGLVESLIPEWERLVAIAREKKAEREADKRAERDRQFYQHRQAA